MPRYSICWETAHPQTDGLAPAHLGEDVGDVEVVGLTVVVGAADDDGNWVGLLDPVGRTDNEGRAVGEEEMLGRLERDNVGNADGK